MYRGIAVLYISVLCAAFGEGMKIKVTDAEIETIDTEYMKVDVKIRNEGGENLLDVDADVIKDLNYDLFLQLHIQKKTNDGLLSVYKSDVVDRCHFVQNMIKYPMLKELFQEMNQYGNVLSECPVLQGHYYLKGFKLEPKTELLKFIANGDYILHIVFMKEIDTIMKTLYSVRFHAEVEN